MPVSRSWQRDLDCDAALAAGKIREIEQRAAAAAQPRPWFTPVIEPIDLPALTKVVLDETATESMHDAGEAVVRAVIARVGRPLTFHEELDAYVAGRVEWNDRDKAKRADLRETQAALASPFRVFGASRG